MKRVLIVLVLGLLSACLPEPTASDSQGRSASVAAGNSGSTPGRDSTPQGQGLPVILAPESFAIHQEREFSILGLDGEFEHFSEVLLADGLGEFRLDIVGWAEGATTNRWTPSQETVALYERRQRYLVRYRDLHLGESSDLSANYGYLRFPDTVSMSGRTCDHYRFRSKYGFGDTTLTVDQETRVVLGWTLSNPEGITVMQMETTLVDFAPNLSGVSWSVPVVGQNDFQSPGDDLTLGFTPLSIYYVPPGFEEIHQKMLLTKAIFQDISNIHLTAFTDGLRVLFVAQQRRPGNSQVDPSAHRHFARESAIGGIRVIDGEIRNQPVFVLGVLPSEELVAIFGSIDF
ncbi:MAG: hypothetical protein VCC04_11110 [Myxococcota bacterium]